MSCIRQVFATRFYEASVGRMLVATTCGGLFPQKRKTEGYRQAAFRLRNDWSVNSAAIFMRLLASTAAATHSSNRFRPSARQRFMPRPRNNTEMHPSIPARKRWPSLNSQVFS